MSRPFVSSFIILCPFYRSLFRPPHRLLRPILRIQSFMNAMQNMWLCTAAVDMALLKVCTASTRERIWKLLCKPLLSFRLHLLSPLSPLVLSNDNDSIRIPSSSNVFFWAVVLMSIKTRRNVMFLYSQATLSQSVNLSRWRPVLKVK